MSSTVVLDGSKVCLGFEGEKLDPLLDSPQADLLRSLLTMNKSPVQAVFEFNLKLNEKLDQMLRSDEPFLYELFKGLDFTASLKFHKKLFRNVLEQTTSKKWEDKLEKKDNPDARISR